MAETKETQALTLRKLQEALDEAKAKGVIKDVDLTSLLGSKRPVLVHPMLKPRKAWEKGLDKKQRRTIFRSVKLVNPFNAAPVLLQVPVEPGTNNMGTLRDPTNPLRYYLNKGFVFPHEYDPDTYDFIHCAVSNCYQPATISKDESGTERCTQHNEMYDKGLIRYATSSKEYDGPD